MLGRRIKRGTPTAGRKDEPEVESPQHVAASDLIGGSGVSLDGQSLVLPDSEMDADEVSSMGTSNYGGGVKTELRILGTADPYDEDVPPPVETPTEEGLGAPTREQIRRQQQRQRMQHYSYERKAYPADDVDDDIGTEKGAKSFDDGDLDDDEGCLPLWLTEAPTWLKLVIVLSTALLVGAIVLIGVGAALSVQEETNPATGGNPSVPFDPPTSPPVMVDPSQPGQPDEPASSPTGQDNTPSTPNDPSTGDKSPTPSPTAMPTSNTVSLFVTAGRFTGDARDKLPAQLPTLPNIDGATVMFHLGDWNSPFATSCSEVSYQENEELYAKSNVPVYFVPGDNEYNDCPDPDQAFGLWYQYVLGFESKHWNGPSHWNITRQQPDYPENFAYVYNGILFVGINLVGGVIHDAREWENRHAANLQWIDDMYAEYYPAGAINTMVVLAHADPDIQANDNFFNTFFQRVETDYQLMTIFIHRNLGIESWGLEPQFNRIENLIMIVVEGSIWPPMLIEIDPMAGIVDVDQTEWYENYINGTST